MQAPHRIAPDADRSSLIMCQSAEDLKFQAQWDGAEGESRTLLLSELSSKLLPAPPSLRR